MSTDVTESHEFYRMALDFGEASGKLIRPTAVHFSLRNKIVFSCSWQRDDGDARCGLILRI